MDTFHYLDISSLDNKSSKDKKYDRVEQMKVVQNEGLELFKKKKCRLWRCICKLWGSWCISSYG